MTSIKVAIKVRPLIQRELNDGMAIEWSVNENTIHTKRGENAFQFDHIFDRTTTNAEVFDTVVKPVIDAAVNGFNGTVFAYGQTSSGKTFTMMGNDNDPGIIPQTITQIFNCIDSTNREFLLRVAYIEIYNERVNDLLDKDNVDLKVREENGEVVVKCKEEVIHMPENILTLMKRGDKNRRIGKTDMNEYSSRSHSIFRIIIESKATDSDADGAVQVSQLNLVDLAGSERASATGATGERFREGRHINLSLSALGKVIMNLSEKADYVGFRDSKLTRILQSSLGGNAMTAIICAVTPASLEETLNTLNFASRAKRIKNKPQLNEVMTDAALLKRYKKQIDTLSQKLQSVDGQNQSEEVKQMANKLEETEQMNRALQERINNLQKNIISGASKSDQECVKKKAKRRQTWAAPARHSMIPRFSMCHLPPIPEKIDLNTTAEEAVPMEDFEVELYHTQLQEEDDLIELPTRLPKVTFSDMNDVTFLSEMSHLSTPRRSNSPGTPKAVLREKLNHAIDELESLKEVTTLEKQLKAEDAQNDLRNEFKELKNQMRLLRHENTNLEESLKLKEENIAQLEKLLEDAMRRTEKISDNLMAGDSVMVLDQTSVLEKVESVICRSIECDLQKKEFAELLQSTDEKLMECRSQVADFEKKLAEMEQERNSFVKKQKEDETTIQKLQDEVQTMEAENFVLTEKMNQLSKMRKEKEELIVKQREFEEQNASFEEKLQNQAEEIEKLRKENENLQKQICESPTEDTRIVECEVALEMLKAEKDRLNEELKQKFEECDNYQLLLNSCEEKLKDSETRINVLSQTMESLLAENESLKSQLSDLETKLSQSEAKSVDLETDNRELSDKLESLEKRLKYELEKEDLSEYLQSLQKKNEELEFQLKELNLQIESMKQVGNSISKLTAVEEKMGEMRKNFEDNKTEMVEQDRMNKEKINDLELKLKDYLEEREKFLNQVKELQELSREYEDKCRFLEIKIEEFKDQEKRSEVLQEKIKELDEILVDEKEKNREWQEKFEEEKSEKERYSEQFEELVKKVQYYETKLEKEMENQEETSNVQEKIEELEKNLKEEKEKTAELQEKFEREKSEKEQNSSDLEKLHEHIQSYKTKIEELQNQEEELTSQLEQVRMERDAQLRHIDQIEKQGRDCESDVQKLQNKIELQNQLMSEEVLRIQRLLDEKEVELKQLRSKLEEQQKLLSLNPKSSTPMNSISQGRDSLEPSETDLNRSQVIKVQPECSPMLRPMVEEILQKSSQSLNSTSIFNNESYFDKLEVTQSEVYSDSMTDSMTDKSMLSSMKKQIQDKNDTDIKNYITDMKESIFGLQKMIVTLSSENENLTETLNKVRADFETTETELQNTIRQLKEQNSMLIDEKNGLETEINSMKTEIENLIQNNEDNEIIASLESENNNLSEQLSRKVEEFEILKQSHVQISDQLQNLQLTSETTLGELQVKNENLKTKLTKLEKEVERLSAENEQLSSEIMDHIEKSEQLQNSEEKTRELVEKIKSLEAQVEQLTEDNKNLGNYKDMKSEVKYLNKQLKEMQKKYEQNVAVSESLCTKARESLDESLLNESLNVSMIQEKLEHADSEFDCLKDIHSLLSISFNKKCEEIERLQAYISSNLTSSEAISAEQNSKKNKIEKLNGELGTLRSDLKQMSGSYENFKTMLEKVKEDMEIMKKENEKLKEQVNLAETKSTTLEKENLTLQETIENFQDQESKFHTEKTDLESVIEKLQTEKSKTEQSLSSVLETEKQIENSLTDELKALQALKDNLSSQLAASESIIKKHEENIVELETTLKETTANLNQQIKENNDLKKHQENVVELETTLKETTANLNQQIKENNELKNQLTKLENDLSKTLAATEDESATTELRVGKEKIINEIKSLDSETKLSTETPLERLFAALLGTIMKKEAEFIQNLQHQIDAQEQKLEQLTFERSEDRKKSDDFIRTLEIEKEQLQAELKEVEKTKGRQMEKNLEQSTENIELFEKLKQERNAFNEQVQELTCENQSISAKNRELLKNLEDFQCKEKEFKLSFEAKSNENLRLSHEISQLKIQLEEISEAYKSVSSEAADKDRRAEQITILLKQEKDKSSEYKTKLENLMPEYENLQEQLKKLKNSIGEYKNKIVSLTDSLNEKSAEYESLKETAEEQWGSVEQSENERKHFKQRCNELESEIAKLNRKLRNSTPGQVTLDDLADKNRMLQNNLEGASNRIVQLQKQNAQYVEEITELKNRIQSFEKELSVGKSFSNRTCNGDSSEQISILQQEVTRLTEKNKELDDENEELAEKIRELQQENGVLENKVLDFEEAIELNTDCWEMKKKLVDAQAEVNEYKEKTVQLEEKLQQAEVKLLSAEKMLDTMNNRNTELQTKVASLEDRLESMSANSTRSNGPAFEMGLRHQRRSSQFNQNRNLSMSGTCECSTNCVDDPNCPCNTLRNKVRDLDFEIVNKNGKIATLELQIRCGNFPHEEKCKRLEKSIAAYKSQLTDALKRIERLKTPAVAPDCENCKEQAVHNRSVATQIPDSLTRVTGIQSGIIWEDQMLRKLEKERDMMKDICRDRRRRILLMESKLKKYEEMYGALVEENDGVS